MKTLMMCTTILAASGIALAGTIELERSVISCGGGTASGGGFVLSGTIGQATAGETMTGGGFSLIGGFWAPETAPPCFGDVDGSGGIDVDDLNAILGAWGAAVGVGSPLDAAGDDGLVNVDDLNVLLANWGQFCG